MIGLPKSAMLSMKPTRKALARPGRISGSVIVEEGARAGSARSVCAASSSAGATPSTTPRTIMKAIGVNAKHLRQPDAEQP